MRVRLLTNNMLNGYSLKMCLDYWHPFNQHHPNRLEWHIKHICRHYDVTSEELRYSPMSRPNNHKIKIELG